MEFTTQEFETITVDGQGRIVERIKSSARVASESLPGEQVRLELAFIPGGIFRMTTGILRR